MDVISMVEAIFGFAVMAGFVRWMWRDAIKNGI